jgi:hypothetical protein
MEKALAVGIVMLVLAMWVAMLRYFQTERKVGFLPILALHADRSPALFRVAMVTLWLGFAVTAAFGGLLLLAIFSGN